MNIVVLIAVVTVVHAVLFFFDVLFKSCMHYPYDAFLQNTGLSVQLFRLRWHTTALNRTIFRWGSSCSRVVIQGFNIGTVVAMVLAVLGVTLLCKTLFMHSGVNTSDISSNNYDMQMQILLPGLNLPLDEIGYYISALLTCTIIHELGHAIAAVIEDVPVNGFGIYLLFCFPFAYTELSTEHMSNLKPLRKLRILCGGIWHNVVLAIILYIVFNALGPILTPFYETNSAVIITHIGRDSYLVGEKGLHKNDIVEKINDCNTNNLDAWHSCLVRTLSVKPSFCVSADFIHLNDETGITAHISDGLVQCCDIKNKKVMCFEYVNGINNDDPLEIPQHLCLDIRKTVEDASTICTTSCDEGFCIKPSLNNATTIFVLFRRNQRKVVYVGHPSDLYHSIKVSGFVPRYSNMHPHLADMISLFLKYNIVFSLGLAIANAIPCFSLDGYQIASTIINSALTTRITNRATRDLTLLGVTCIGTVLFLCTITKVLWASLFIKVF